MTKPGSSRHADIVAVILALSEGEVVGYGDIADAAGHQGRARLVGRILAEYSDSLDLPWWRVVNSQGRLVPGVEAEQAGLLRDEGVEVRGGGASARVTWSPRGRFAGRKGPGRRPRRG